DCVTVARTFGSSSTAIFWRHVLPNVANLLIVQATVAFALAILAEAALSYLGLGTQPPTPSWGRMLNDAQNYLNQSAQLALWPGLSIAHSVLVLNLLRDELRHLIHRQPHQREPRIRAGLDGSGRGRSGSKSRWTRCGERCARRT